MFGIAALFVAKSD